METVADGTFPNFNEWELVNVPSVSSFSSISRAQIQFAKGKTT